MRLQNQQSPNCLHWLKQIVHKVNMVLLPTACSNCHQKDNCGYSTVYNERILQFFCQCFYLLTKTSCFRLLLLRFKTFWFLEERMMPYNVHRRVSCGALLLFLLHKLVIKLVTIKSLFYFCLMNR